MQIERLYQEHILEELTYKSKFMLLFTKRLREGGRRNTGLLTQQIYQKHILKILVAKVRLSVLMHSFQSLWRVYTAA